MVTPITFNVSAITQVAGLLYGLMAITVWQFLRGKGHAKLVRLWSLATCVGGAGLMLAGGRDTLPDLLAYSLSGSALGFSMLVHTHALREHLGLPSLVRPLGVAWLVTVLVSVSLLLVPDLRVRALLMCPLWMASAFGLGLHATWVHAQTGSAGARLIAWTHWLLALALAVRMVAILGGWTTVQGIYQGWDYAVVMVCAVLAGLYSNLGFLGLMLDTIRAAELRAQGVQLAETLRREAAERSNLELRDMVSQRDQLLAERERLLQLLAHEIRQPLHNASGALQAAGQALRDAPAAGSAEATQRLGRAEAVLGEVRSVLDNTLAAATLLSRNKPLVVQDVDLDFLIDLCLGDLSEAQRQVVQVQWFTDLRQAELEPGLVRLALRNLLVNAFSHGGPGVAVQLQVAEQAEPPALLLRVIDNGVGLDKSSAALATGERPGLGLPIVRQVAALHAGTFALQAQLPQGVQAELSLPLPAP